MANRFDESKYHLLEAYIESGSTGNLEEDEIDYLQILTLMNSMRRKYGKEKTLKFFQKPPYGISAYRCKQMFDESINLFYSNEKVEKKALRALKADQLEKAAELVMATAKCAADIEVYGKLIRDSAIIRQLDKVDPPAIPEELYKKPIKIYSLDPGVLKLPKANRNKLAERIDALTDVTEKDRQRFKQEAQIEEIDFEEQIDELTEKNN